MRRGNQLDDADDDDDDDVVIEEEESVDKEGQKRWFPVKLASNIN